VNTSVNRARSFVADLARLRFDNVFNPYSDICREHDLPEAPSIRRHNLEVVLARAIHIGTRSIWIGLELGRGGGRRTGLAMTDDAHLCHHAARFGARGVKCATKSGPTTEITAGAVWSALAQIREPIFLWNIFPFHSHKPGVPLSNRRHSRVEQIGCLPVLNEIFSLFAPKTIVTIGMDARTVLSRQDYKFHSVRHPAFGGKSIFLKQISDIYRRGSELAARSN
jgi:hypothetical protein